MKKVLIILGMMLWMCAGNGFGAQTNRICLVVASNVYDAISSNLNIYIQDLEAAGYTVITSRFTSGTAEDLRAYFQGLYAEPESLAGAQLIGNLPYAVYEMMTGVVGYQDFPSDLFLMDLDGTWLDITEDEEVHAGNGKYDARSGDLGSEIWVSRWKTDMLVSLGSETNILNNYFVKNHKYRQRILKPAWKALVYVDDEDAADGAKRFRCYIEVAYGLSAVTVITNKETTTAADFKTNRLPVDQEWISVEAHGGTVGFVLYRNNGTIQEGVYSTDYISIDPPALYYVFQACECGDFSAGNNLASIAAFNDNSGLFAVGATAAFGGGLGDTSYFQQLLMSGYSFGAAYFESCNISTNARDGSLIGDATLGMSPVIFLLDLDMPPEAKEGDGVLVNAGTVSIPWAVASNVTVTLSSDNTNELTVPASVVITAGQESVSFNLTVKNDVVQDGPKTAIVTVSASQWTGHKASIRVLDNEAGTLDHFEWGGISSPQNPDIPIPVIVTAKDASGNTVTGFTGTVNMAGKIKPGSTILITECGLTEANFVEIQNVSGQAIDTEGWKVVLGNGYESMDNVNSNVWQLPASIQPGQILYKTDNPTNNYLGGNIRWGQEEFVHYGPPPSWAMVVDNHNDVVDFLAWGWSENSIGRIRPKVAGELIKVGNQFTGEGVSPSCFYLCDKVIQRQGGKDSDNATDFVWDQPASKGVQNTGLAFPAGCQTNIDITPVITAGFTNGVWVGSITALEDGSNVYFLAYDGSGHKGSSDVFNVEYIAEFTVFVTADAEEGDGILTNQGMIVISEAPVSNLVVNLLSSDTTEVTVASTVTILSGQTNAVFDLAIQDDTDLDGSQNASITAWRNGYRSGSDDITVHDSETAVLRVKIPESGTEGGSVQGAVTMSQTPDTDVTVNLTSGDITEAIVSAVVTIQSGYTNAVFDIILVDDMEFDGTQAVDITAHVENWTNGADTIEVLDNKQFTVIVPSQAYEGAGVLTNAGMVSMSGTLTNDLTVYLASDDTNEVNVPVSIIIPSGQTGVTFNVIIMDDAEYDGAQTVVITASASGYVAGNDSMEIKDNEVHHFEIGGIGTVQTAGVPFSVAIMARDVSNAVIGVYTGMVEISGNGDVGAVVVNPEYSGIFTNGEWTGQVTVETADSDVRLTADDVATGTSNPFDVLPGDVEHFTWDEITSPEGVSNSFDVAVTARDAYGNIVTGYSGPVRLEGYETVDVLSFVRYSDMAQEYPQTKQAISNYFPNYVETSTVTTNPAELETELEGKDVFLVMEQENTPVGMMAGLGTAWSNVLNNFVSNGGIVVACSYQKDEHMILTNSRLLSLSQYGWQLSGIISYSIPHVVSEGVITSSVCNAMALWFVNSNKVLGLYTNTMSVACRDIGLGHAVMIGTDFSVLGTEMDKVIANAVKWARGSVSITPTNTGSFVDGVWTGSITVAEESFMYLRADDGNGHTGDSNPFDIWKLAPMGTPEWWLEEHDLTNSTPDIDEMSDTDEDGMPAWQEYVAGTLPANGNSVLTITDAMTLSNDCLVIYWMSVTGKYYTIAESTNLFLGFSPLTSGIPATPPENVYTSPVINSSPHYYRIKAEE